MENNNSSNNVGARINVGDLATIEAADGQIFQIPLADTLFELRKLTESKPVDEELGQAIQAYIVKAAGATLAIGEAINLYEALELEYARKKKAWQSDMNAIVGLPGSTAA